MLGRSCRTSAAKFGRITTAPARCHALRPDHSRLGHQAKPGTAAPDTEIMSGNARILLSHNVFRLSIPGLVGNFPNEVLPANSIETGQFLSLAQSAPQ